MWEFVTFPEVKRLFYSLVNRMNSVFGVHCGRSIIYGSKRDGTDMLDDTDTHSSYSDVDVMVYLGYLSEKKKDQCIRYLDSTPGFVHIDVTKMTEDEISKCFPAHDNLDVTQRDGKKYLSALNYKMINFADFAGSSETEEQAYLAAFSECQLPVDPSSAAISFRIMGAHGLNLHMDHVVCVACCGWPSVAASWSKRKRFWPSQSLIKEIANSVFHLVHKPSPSGDAEIEWRLSFSFAESKLMDSITGLRLATYRILKQCIKQNVRIKHINVLSTYHLKTVLFWECESNTEEFWKLKDIDECLIKVLDSMILSFSTGNITHYFIPEINLLSDIPMEDLVETSNELVQMKSELKIMYLSPKPEDAEEVIIELAWVKVQHDSCLKQLSRKETDASGDYGYILKNDIRELSAFISHIATLACYSENQKIIDKTQLWYLEETLSCAYAILSAWSDKMNSCVVAYKDLHDLVDDFCEPNLISDTETQILNIELPHGHYRSVFEQENQYPEGFNQLRNQYRIVEMDIFIKSNIITFTRFDLLVKLYLLVDKIINPEWSEGTWDLDMMTDAVKQLLPNFKWSDEGHLSVHQLAQEGVWLSQIPFDALVQQKDIPSLSFKSCHGDCLDRRLNSAKKILFDKHDIPQINMFQVAYKGNCSIYGEGEQLENLEIFHILKGPI